MSQSPQPIQRRRSVAKLLARLNPKGIGIPTGGGRGTAGSHEDAIDIAAALGAVGQGSAPRRLAALVLCLRWWPGVFEGPSRVVARRDVVRTTTRVGLIFDTNEAGSRTALQRQADGSARRGEITSSYVESVGMEVTGETEAYRAVASLLSTRLLARLTLDRDVASAPRRTLRGLAPPMLPDTAARVINPEFTAAWARAVIHEYRHPNQCNVCLGYGEQMKIVTAEPGGKPKAEISSCEQCGGQGVLAWSVKRRAKAMRINEHTWRDYLNAHHGGALALLRELEWRGARLLVRRLGVSDER